jgi:GTP-binding protein LepA
MPLAEIVFDFYDRLKTVSKGYAPFDYRLANSRTSNLVKVDIGLTPPLYALSSIDSAWTMRTILVKNV